MGLLESLGQLMVKLFGMEGKMKEANREYMENITLSEIEELERQGCDMTEYRRTYAERIAREEARYNHLMGTIDLSKLNNYKLIPRDINDDFSKDTATLNAISAKDVKQLEEAKIVYASVVQAHSDLWESEGFGSGFKGVVLIIALDEKYMYDQEWLVEMANKISQMKESANEIPADNKKMIKNLRDSESTFCFKVGASIAGDTNLWCATYTIFDQKKLPNSSLPPNRILPVLLLDNPVEGKYIDLALIPAKYFSK